MPSETTPSYLKGLSPSTRVAIEASRKPKLDVVYRTRNPSVTIDPKNGPETTVPILACNSDPATVDIPIRGKVLLTWSLIALWSGIMTMTMVVAKWNYAGLGINPMLGPSADILIETGAIAPDEIVSGEYWRLLWATQMHAGWIHLGLNIINFLPLGYILEPDWGFMKLLFVFLCSAISGSLTSINGSESIAVGASGGIFGLMAGLLIYVSEYWKTIPHARSIFILTLILVLISIGLSFVPFVDKWAHIGGAVGGFLASLCLLRDLPIFLKRKKSSMINTLVPQDRDPISVDPQQYPSDRIRVYRITDDIYADVPAMAQPALIKTVNRRARRWINLRRARRTADPLSWVNSEEHFQMRSLSLWCIRFASGLCLIGSWIWLFHARFDLRKVFGTMTVNSIPEVLEEALESDAFLAKTIT